MKAEVNFVPCVAIMSCVMIARRIKKVKGGAFYHGNDDDTEDSGGTCGS